MKKGNSTLYIIIILITIIIALGGYLIYDKVLKDEPIKDIPKENNNEEQTENNNEEQKENTEEDINGLGKELFERTLYSEYGKDTYTLYDSNKSIDTLENTDKLRMAYRMANKTKVVNNAYMDGLNIETFEHNTCSVNIDDKNCYLEKVTKNNFENAYYKLFGNKNVKYEEFLDDNLYCSATKEYVACIWGAGMDNFVENKLRFKDAELHNSQIIINVEQIFLIEDSENAEKYKDYETLNEKDFFEKYQNDVTKYKVIFKQNENKDYYWYSTEVVK